MSLDHLPANIEQSIQSYAASLHISHDEALLKIIETGLTVVRPEIKNAAIGDENLRIPGLTGKPMSDEDAAMMDEIVDEAMKARQQRWEQYQRA